MNGIKKNAIAKGYKKKQYNESPVLSSRNQEYLQKMESVACVNRIMSLLSTCSLSHNHVKLLLKNLMCFWFHLQKQNLE